MSNYKYLEGKTLHEKQLLFYNGSRCPYCFGYTEFIDSKEVYQESHGFIFICRRCESWCTTLPNSDQCAGSLANKELRQLRRKTQELLQPLIERKVRYGYERRKVQIKVREWISKILNRPLEESHIAMMDIPECNKMIAEIKSLEKTPEEIEAIKNEIATRKEMIRFLCDSMEIELKQFNMGHFTQYTFEKNGKKYHYNFRDHAGYWDGKAMKFKKVEVPIDEFLNTHFSDGK